MRISEFLRATCVGALLFSPAMADEIEKVHDDALRALHETLGQTNGDLAAPVQSNSPEAVQLRAEREARFQADAQQRIAERQRMQAQRHQEFEQWAKDRERLRQEQREYDLNAARTVGQIQLTRDQNDVHMEALNALHREESAASAAEMTTMMLAQADVDKIHQQALDALHQSQNQAPQAPAVSAPKTNTSVNSSGPQPSPDLQRRLKQMQLELEQEQAQKDAAAKAGKGAKATPANNTSGVSDAYIKDLEQRAQQQQGMTATPAPQVGISSGSGGNGSAAPGLDPATRDILRKQDQEIARQMGSNASASTRPAPSPQSSKSNATASAAPAPASNPPSAPIKPAKTTAQATTHRVETDNANAAYSKDLEERARQILAERAQNQQNATVQSPAAPNTGIVPSAPAQTSVTPAPQPAVAPSAPVTTAPTPTPTPTAAAPAPTTPRTTAAPTPSNDVHAQALDRLNQIQAGTAPKTKQEKLKELTDLYRADKMSPAEYHQKRAQILAEPQ